MHTPITVAYGDGIGPEIMQAVLSILEAAKARISVEVIEIGEKVYLAGNASGIEDSAWESLRRTKVFLKAPITTPQGGGYKSLNVTTRKKLGLYANVRPCIAYPPYVETKYPDMDLVIIRENEEDLYAGIEYRQTEQVVQSLKIISRPGCERIVRYAFEYARQFNRKKVTCFTKDNIMKMADGLFHKVFDEIGAEYPEIEKEHWIIDIGAAKMADTPENFDVIVTLNLYGDILSDIAAQIAGSVGLAGSSNIGTDCAMFEAIHGSAPRRAGQNLANPSGLLLGAVMMLVHIGQSDIAELVHNAWLKTLEDGYHTYDIYNAQRSVAQVGTREFANAIISRLGQRPSKLKAITYSSAEQKAFSSQLSVQPEIKREICGIDLFLRSVNESPSDLGKRLFAIGTDKLTAQVLTNRGTKVWPDGIAESFCTDQFRCRYTGTPGLNFLDLVELQQRVNSAGFEIVKTENLYMFDGVPSYSAD